MTAASLLATNNADFEIDFAEQPTQPLDSRRITEHDADFVRLHSRTARALKASVRQLVRELRADAHDVTAAQSRFIQRHMDLLRRAYIAAHKEGQRDYYAPISNTPRKWVSDPPTALVQRRLTWYGLSSVLKMAHEAQRAVASERHALSEGETRKGCLSDSSGGLRFARLPQPAPDALHDQLNAARYGSSVSRILLASNSSSPVDLYLANVDVRADLQANIAWSGLQDGYLDGGASDSVGLYSLVWWSLEPSAQHCSQCPELAADSPYNAPGLGGNELPATPGDGYTACGAGCKCSLEYRSANYLDTVATDQVLRALGQEGVLDLPGDTLPPGPTQPPDDGYTDNQRAALDLYRGTARAWDAATEGTDLPPFPPFIRNWTGWEGWAELDWDTLPPQLRQLVYQMLEARRLWGTPAEGA